MARNSMHVVVRSNVSAKVGAGHLTRCVALLQALQTVGEAPVRASFLFDPQYLERQTLVETVLRRLHAPVDVGVDPGDMSCFAGADWVVVDHYDLGADYEIAVRGSGPQVLAIDDLLRRHTAEILVDQTLGRTPTDYSDRVPGGCLVLAGVDYALLQPEFAAQHGIDRPSRGMRPDRLFVSFGLSERTGLAVRSVAALAQLPKQPDLRVVTAATDPHLVALERALAEYRGKAELFVDAADLIAHMRWADLAIGGGGVTTWERCCLGLPTVLVVTADNQRDIAKAVASAGAVRLLSAAPDDATFETELERTVTELLIDESELSLLSTRASDLVDGRGAERVAQAMLRQRSFRS